MRAASVNRHQERSGRNALGSDRVLAWWTSARVIGYSEASDCFRVVGNPSLIWSDPVNSANPWGCFLLLFEDGASSSRGRCERRL